MMVIFYITGVMSTLYFILKQEANKGIIKTGLESTEKWFYKKCSTISKEDYKVTTKRMESILRSALIVLLFSIVIVGKIKGKDNPISESIRNDIAIIIGLIVFGQVTTRYIMKKALGYADKLIMYSPLILILIVGAANCQPHLFKELIDSFTANMEDIKTRFIHFLLLAVGVFLAIRITYHLIVLVFRFIIKRCKQASDQGLSVLFGYLCVVAIVIDFIKFLL